jgi:hypothetical protein
LDVKENRNFYITSEKLFKALKVFVIELEIEIEMEELKYIMEINWVKEIKIEKNPRKYLQYSLFIF